MPSCLRCLSKDRYFLDIFDEGMLLDTLQMSYIPPSRLSEYIGLRSFSPVRKQERIRLSDKEKGSYPYYGYGLRIKLFFLYD